MGTIARTHRRSGRIFVVAMLIAALLPAGLALALEPTPTLVFKRAFGTEGSGPKQMYHPWGVAIDKQGRMYVADTNNHRIQVYASDGSFLKTIGTGVGQEEGQLYYPEALALDDPADPGFLYVADSANNRIQVFDVDSGASVQTWGKAGDADGDLNVPRGIATDGSYVYGVDTRNYRVQKFTTAGTFVKKWGVAGVGEGAFEVPSGISVDNGNVYVVDEYGGTVQVFDTNGGFITKFGEYGSEEGQLNFPDEIAVCGNTIYIAEAGISRVSRFVNLDGAVSFQATFTGTSAPGTHVEFPHGVSCVRQFGDDVVAVASTNESRIYKYSEELVDIKIDPNEKPSALKEHKALRYLISHDAMYERCILEQAVAFLVISEGDLIGYDEDETIKANGVFPKTVRAKKTLVYDIQLNSAKFEKVKKAINNNLTIKVTARFKFDDDCDDSLFTKRYKIT